MNRHNVENYKMLTRVADFAAKNVGLFPKSSAGLEVQKSLEAEVQELAELSSARISAESALRPSRNDRANAQDALKELFVRADLTARALGSDRFRSPRKPSDHALIASGRVFAADIEPLKKEFAGYGFSPDAVTAAVKALERAVRGCAPQSPDADDRQHYHQFEIAERRQSAFVQGSRINVHRSQIHVNSHVNSQEVGFAMKSYTGPA